MDLSRVKSTKEKITIIQEDKYPNTPVITLLAHNKEDNKRHTLTLNRKAMSVLNVDAENNKLIMFDEYDISSTEEPEYDSVIGVVSQSKVQGPKKQYRAYDIHLSTRYVKSKDIYNSISSLFDLTEGKEYELEIIPVSHLNGVFTLNLMKESVDSEITVEVEFNKGEDIVVEEQH